MNIKLLSIVIFGVLTFLSFPKEMKACEIEFEIINGKKEVYKTGDTLVIKVTVALTHRACPIAMQKTKFNMKDIEVIKSTPWKQLSEMNYERKLMIVVKETQDGKLNLTAIRECDKDGGFGSIKLEAIPNQ